MVDNIKEDRTPEDLLFQIMLDLGVELSSPIEEVTIDNTKIYKVKDNYLVACFDKGLTKEIITEIAKMQPYYFVTRDNSMLNNDAATNFEQIFNRFSPGTDRRVL